MQGRIETTTGNDLLEVPLCRVSIETERDGRRTCVNVDCAGVEDAAWLLLSLGLDEVLTGHRQLEPGQVRGWWNADAAKADEPSHNGASRVVSDAAVKASGNGASNGKHGSKRDQVWQTLAKHGKAGARVIDIAQELGWPRSNVSSHINGLVAVSPARAERVREGVYRALGGEGNGGGKR